MNYKQKYSEQINFPKSGTLIRLSQRRKSIICEKYNLNNDE